MQLMPQGQECHLKLRPIWVLEKGKVPDLNAGVFEAVPQGFERILEKTEPMTIPKAASKAPPIRVTRPHGKVITNKKAEKKSKKKWTWIATKDGNMKKAYYWE